MSRLASQVVVQEDQDRGHDRDRDLVSQCGRMTIINHSHQKNAGYSQKLNRITVISVVLYLEDRM